MTFYGEAQGLHMLRKTGGLSVHCTIENNSLQHQLLFQQLEKYLIGFSNGILVFFKHENLLICSVSCCALKHPAMFFNLVCLTGGLHTVATHILCSFLYLGDTRLKRPVISYTPTVAQATELTAMVRRVINILSIYGFEV